jgi:formate--tetrahydrofolate ligase
MLVAIAGDIMRMPGLPKEPAALQIDIVNGEIEGLS